MLPFLLFFLEKTFHAETFRLQIGIHSNDVLLSEHVYVYVIHMSRKEPFEIASVIHRLPRIREFIRETNLAVILDPASGTPTARFVFSLFSSSLESLTIFSFSCIAPVSHFRILNFSYASSSTRCFVFRPHACLLHT